MSPVGSPFHTGKQLYFSFPGNAVIVRIIVVVCQEEIIQPFFLCQKLQFLYTHISVGSTGVDMGVSFEHPERFHLKFHPAGDLDSLGTDLVGAQQDLPLSLPDRNIGKTTGAVLV